MRAFIIFFCLISSPTGLFAQSIDLGSGGGGQSSSEPLPPSMSGLSHMGVMGFSRAGTTVSSSSGLDSLTTNPAGMIFSRGKGAFGGDWASAPGNLQRWQVGLVDGRKNVMGGISYDFAEQNRVNRQGIHASVLYETQYGAVGATFSSYHFANLRRQNGWQFTQTMGLIAPIAYGLTIGISGNHFADAAPDSILSPSLQMGLGYEKPGYLKFAFQTDRRFSVSGQDFNYSWSGDLILRKFFVLRAGYRWDHSTDESFYSVGGAIEAPRLHVAGYFLQATEGNKAKGFGGSLIYFF